jgi:hypothetical protein
VNRQHSLLPLCSQHSVHPLVHCVQLRTVQESFPWRVSACDMVGVWCARNRLVVGRSTGVGG